MTRRSSQPSAASTTTTTPRKRPFTARTVAHLKPEAHAVDWTDAITPGLSLRVTPAGARTWYVLYKRAGKARRQKLGAWPGLSLAKARLDARAARLRVDRDQADPAAERQAARAALKTVYTVAELCDLFITQHAKVHKRTWKDDEWRINRYILPAWKARAVAEITRSDAHALLDRIVADGKPIQANRTQALISKLWNFAIDREHATMNPCYRMAKHAAERIRATVLTDDDIRACWRALEAAPGDASDALKLRLLTGARGGEVHTIEWADLDLKAKIWTLPAARAKNKQVHTIPLSASAAAILETRLAARVGKEPRVFPGLYHQRDDLRALASIHNGAYRWHDLRRVVASRLAALGLHEDVIGRVLNHARRGITATVYNRHAYDAEKRTALQTWARELNRIVSKRPKSGAAVVPMRGRG